MDMQLQVLGVTVGNTSTGRQFWAVACSDGIERRCWNAQLAQRINTYVGQTVTLRFDVKQNGNFTNYSVKAIAGQGETLPPEQAGGGFAPTNGAAHPATFAPHQGGNGKANGGGFPPETTTRITKLASYNYAALIVSGLMQGAGPEALSEALEHLDAAAKHIYQAARSHEQGGPPTVSQGVPAPQDAQGVADFANAQAPGAVQVGAPVQAPAPAPDVIDWG